MSHKPENKRTLILATRNAGKIAEIEHHLASLKIEIKSLLDLPESIDIVESGASYSENALIKSMVVHKAAGAMAMADDSGLEIDALNGEPGIYSARYGGAGLSDSERNLLVLKKLEKIPLTERGARFVCAAVIVDETGRSLEFRGALEGYIGCECKGSEGFGYDPIFFLRDSGKSLAELGLEVKNHISHRAVAMKQVRSYLERYLKDIGAQKGL